MILHGFKRIFFGVAASSIFLAGLVLLMSGASLSARAAAGDLFVSPTAGESACSQAEPCALPTGMSHANDGHTIYLAEGTYTGTGSAGISVTRSITLVVGGKTETGPGCAIGRILGRV